MIDGIVHLRVTNTLPYECCFRGCSKVRVDRCEGCGGYTYSLRLPWCVRSRLHHRRCFRWSMLACEALSALWILCVELCLVSGKYCGMIYGVSSRVSEGHISQYKHRYGLTVWCSELFSCCAYRHRLLHAFGNWSIQDRPHHT